MALFTFLQFALLNESRDPEVERVQAGLKALGEPWAGMLGKTGPNGDGVDGEMGPLTREALLLFLKEAEPDLKVGNLEPAKIRALGIDDSSSKPGAPSPSAGPGTGTILVHGLTSARSAETQRGLLARGMGKRPAEIGLFSYKGDGDRIERAIRSAPGSTVVLYSAGCANAGRVAETMKGAGSDLRRLWCLEPWAKGSGTVKTIRSAISLGMPESNVIAGPGIERGGGKDVWAGAGQTPAGKDHFGALVELGKRLVLQPK